MKIVCIDFETANRFIGSICAVGVAVIEQGQISQTGYWLVKPHADCNIFDPFNIMIHGIQPRDVQNALEFNAIYDEIRPLLSDSILVAHNAAFDMSALRHVLDLYILNILRLTICVHINYLGEFGVGWRIINLIR